MAELVHARTDDALDPAHAIARTVLYEGYMLWPYRRSALKNQKRWTFGGVLPPAWSAEHPDERSSVHTQVLAVTGPREAAVSVEVRFLHTVRRRIARVSADTGSLEFVDSITAGGERHVAWDEAVERAIDLPDIPLRHGASARARIDAPAASDTEWIIDEAGERAGAIIRDWSALDGAIEVAIDELVPPAAQGGPPSDDDLATDRSSPGPRVVRVDVGVRNETSSDAATRESALRSSLLSLHVVLRAEHAEFSSMQDPPPALAMFASSCESDGLWPVLITSNLVLAAPIILSDFPAVAPESPGDLFDGGEVDELLVYNIMALTDDEKAEMRATDPRTRDILERTASLSRAQITRLHGTFRNIAETP